MTAVERVDADTIRLGFDAHEAAILAEVAGQLAALLASATGDSAEKVLFRNAYSDPAAQAEFSRFTRDDLSAQKVAAAETVRDALTLAPAVEESSHEGVIVELSTEQAWQWLTFFTDVRLVLSERIAQSVGNTNTSGDLELQQGIFDWAAYLQGVMVDELSDDVLLS